MDADRHGWGELLGRVLAGAVVVAFWGGCVTRPETASAELPEAGVLVVELVGERLELAERVAWIKYRDGLPIDAPEREASSLRTLVAAGERRGLSAGVVTGFFAAQMRASRMEQAERTRSWSRGGVLPTRRPESLADDVRPAIDRINAELLEALPPVLALGEGDRARLGEWAERELRAAGHSGAASRAAVSGWR
jgi:chorismate mutase